MGKRERENKVGTIRRNIFVKIPHYHDMISYNKQLLDEHLKKAAECTTKRERSLKICLKKQTPFLFPCQAKRSTYADTMNLNVTDMGNIMEGKHFYCTSQSKVKNW